jgi:predicted ribosome quality control (RQC) complex YloA/Tae2 family protein
VFPEVIGETLQDVVIAHDERFIRLEFINTTINFILFGGSKNNIIVTNKQEVIITAFKHNHDLLGKNIDKSFSKNLSFEEFPKDSTLMNVLSKCDMLLGKYYAEEVCIRSGYDPHTIVSSLTGDEVNIIKHLAKQIREECLNSKHYVLINSGLGQHLLSLIPLAKHTEIEEYFESVSSAVTARISLTLRDARFYGLYKKLKAFLEKEKTRLVKKTSMLTFENLSKEREDLYTLRAELLFSYFNPKEKGGDKITLKDYSGNELEIPLDSKLTIIENANRYFEKSRNSRIEMKNRKERLPKLLALLEKYDSALTRLNSVKTIKELEKLENFADYEFGMSVAENKPEGESRFRTFDLGEGFFLYVGKNSVNNDELTTQFAKQNDLWFHARGIGGSHAVLRIEKNQKPTKQIIKKAAEITAYYSQARKAKYIPVAYTLKKYVRKPKGVNSGTVFLEREEVVMVEPKLPV